jgi:hypothetical protein
MVQLILTLAAFSAAACTPAQAISLRSTRASGCARIRGLPVDALDLVGRDYPAIEHAGFIAAAFFGHSRRQLLANAATAASRVAA